MRNYSSYWVTGIPLYYTVIYLSVNWKWWKPYNCKVGFSLMWVHYTIACTPYIHVCNTSFKQNFIVVTSKKSCNGWSNIFMKTMMIPTSHGVLCFTGRQFCYLSRVGQKVNQKLMQIQYTNNLMYTWSHHN